jgi:two-component sensor histidine kinase
MKESQLKKRARSILIFFLFSTALIVGLSWTAFNILSASQSFISYHSLWTQSQQRAIIHLISYMNSKDEQEYYYFRESVGIMDNIQKALYELNMEDPDVSFVEKNLNLNIIDQDEIQNVIWLFGMIRNFETYRGTFENWENFHQQVSLFEQLGEYVRTEVQNEEQNVTIKQLLNLAEGLNIVLTEEQASLLSEFRAISLFIKKVSISFIILISIALIVIGLILSKSWIKGFKELKKANNEKDQLAKFPSLNPNPVVEISGTGQLSYVNNAANKHFPDLWERKLSHCFLNSDSHLFNPDLYKNHCSRIREIEIGDTVYEQIIYYLPELKKFHVYGYDITRRKQFRDSLQKAVEEKEVLLAEIHHRVKNNLAIIAGLLELESDNTDHTETKNVLRNSVSRVLSMASVHEQLYANKSFSEIRFLDYVKELAIKLHQTLDSEKSSKTIMVTGDDILLNVNQAIPCGILVSELINNAYKHAFPKGKRPGNGEKKIRIHIGKQNDLVLLTVCDNGIGLPAGFDYRNLNSLGYTLIKSLADQLEGKIEFENKGGTAVTCSFKKAEIRGSASSFVSNGEPDQ